MDTHLSIYEIMLRLFLAILMGGAIGAERELHNRPAGLRTHILVCMGATIIALIQVEIGYNALQTALSEPRLAGVVRSDEARLIAQVVSGVGFLGAGTIIVTNRSIKGLTTAASIWAGAGLGLAIGMGFYAIAFSSFVGIMAALIVVKRVIKVHAIKKIEIRYIHREETKEFIMNYFDSKKIEVEDVDFDVDFMEDYRIYTNVYTIDLPKGLSYTDVIEDLSMYKNITKLRMINV
ncbi:MULTISPECIES: MgtC/SapB family protein [Enterococcus]|uniref:MgtC/SapB family protein n=1 Tax=Enterococcus alishanensis TaxID=1303817 RepID=A0ABS6T8Y0_9ENTE|nr:MgtC/SapB family protein [Enterococcus alishanensis]MBV7389353.1 MgtC/SapB family protein [Enterococcus alishanensis]